MPSRGTGLQVVDEENLEHIPPPTLFLYAKCCSPVGNAGVRPWRFAMRRPKGPKSSYIIFYAEEMASVKAAGPSMSITVRLDTATPSTLPSGLVHPVSVRPSTLFSELHPRARLIPSSNQCEVRSICVKESRRLPHVLSTLHP